MSWVVDFPVAGQLICLLPVFTAALAVPLSRESSEAAARPAHFPRRKNKIDERQNGVHALCALFSAARGQHHGGFAESQGPRGELDVGDGDAGDNFRPFGGGFLHGGADVGKSTRVFSNEI